MDEAGSHRAQRADDGAGGDPPVPEGPRQPVQLPPPRPGVLGPLGSCSRIRRRALHKPPTISMFTKMHHRYVTTHTKLCADENEVTIGDISWHLASTQGNCGVCCSTGRDRSRIAGLWRHEKASTARSLNDKFELLFQGRGGRMLAETQLAVQPRFGMLICCRFYCHGAWQEGGSNQCQCMHHVWRCASHLLGTASSKL